MEHKRNSFVFYADWVEILMDYPAEVRLEVYDAVMWYAVSGKLSELKPQAKMAFSFIRKQIDRDNEKYDEIIVKRSEAGKKGGKNKQTQAKQANANKTSKCKQTQANQADNVNVNVDVNDNVLKKETGNTGVLPRKEKTQKPPGEDSETEKTETADTSKPLPAKPPEPKKAFAEYVSMKQSEFDKLVADYGEEDAKGMIGILNAYKGANGKNYKSDYLAILNWVVRRYYEEQNNYKTGPIYANNQTGNRNGRRMLTSDEADYIIAAANALNQD